MKFLRWNFAKKNFRKRVLQQIFFLEKTQFYLKTWCVVKMLIQNLTRCKNFHSKTDDLWKRWLEDSLVMKTLVQKLFPNPVFFLKLILFKEALNCHLWGFYRVILQKKNSKASFAREVDFMKAQFYLETWCFVKMLIQHLTRCEIFHSKTDELWRSWLMKTLVSIFWFKNYLLIQIFSQINSL